MKSILTTLVLLLTLLSFMWAAGLGMYTIKVISAEPAMSTKKTDAIIVLTGGNFRIETGMRLWSANLAQDLFITGVYKDVTRRAILDEWNDKIDLPYCCLTLGYRATTTEGNAMETKEWVEENHVRSARLVTSKYHMPRALFEFRTLMPDLTIIPHPVEILDYEPEHRMFWKLTMLEYHKVLARQFERLSGYRYNRQDLESSP